VIDVADDRSRIYSINMFNVVLIYFPTAFVTFWVCCFRTYQLVNISFLVHKDRRVRFHKGALWSQRKN